MIVHGAVIPTSSQLEKERKTNEDLSKELERLQDAHATLKEGTLCILLAHNLYIWICSLC